MDLSIFEQMKFSCILAFGTADVNVNSNMTLMFFPLNVEEAEPGKNV